MIFVSSLLKNSFFDGMFDVPKKDVNHGRAGCSVGSYRSPSNIVCDT